MKRALLAIAAIALVSLSSAEAAEKVRVGMPTEGFLYTPLYLAIDAGFMKDEGLEAELIQFKGGGAAMGGLVSGSVEFCTCAIQNAINATVKGSGVTLIGTIIGQYASNMVLRDDVAKRLGITHDTPIKQRLAALRGLKIAGSGVGSSTDFLIRYLALKGRPVARARFHGSVPCRWRPDPGGVCAEADRRFRVFLADIGYGGLEI